MGLSSTVSEIDGDFYRKSRIFPTPLVFYVPADAVPLEIEYWGKESKN